MKLTKEEEKLILKKRKSEADKLPRKVGFLKEDLFAITDCTYDYSDGEFYYSKSDKELEIENFASTFQLALKAGDKFDCYIDDGEEQWYDSEGFGIEGMSADWAKKHLKDIKKLK